MDTVLQWNPLNVTWPDWTCHNVVAVVVDRSWQIGAMDVCLASLLLNFANETEPTNCSSPTDVAGVGAGLAETSGQCVLKSSIRGPNMNSMWKSTHKNTEQWAAAFSSQCRHRCCFHRPQIHSPASCSSSQSGSTHKICLKNLFSILVSLILPQEQRGWTAGRRGQLLPTNRRGRKTVKGSHAMCCGNQPMLIRLPICFFFFVRSFFFFLFF